MIQNKVIAKDYHPFVVCSKCFYHMAHIVVIRCGGAVDDLLQSTNINIVV